MNVEINWLAVVLATAASMVVGSIWYAKGVLGKRWQKLTGITDAQMKQGAGQAIGITILVSFVTAFVLAHVTYLSHSFFRNSFLYDALMTAFWLWLGLTAARFVTHDVFERRPPALTAMTVVFELVTLLSMGLIIGLVRP